MIPYMHKDGKCAYAVVAVLQLLLKKTRNTQRRSKGSVAGEAMETREAVSDCTAREAVSDCTAGTAEAVPVSRQSV